MPHELKLGDEILWDGKVFVITKRTLEEDMAGQYLNFAAHDPVRAFKAVQQSKDADQHNQRLQEYWQTMKSLMPKLERELDTIQEGEQWKTEDPNHPKPHDGRDGGLV